MRRGALIGVGLVAGVVLAGSGAGAVFARAPRQSAPQQQPQPFEPTVGQAGKDVVWVPTSPELVDKMLDMARVTPEDFVIDLGSGDGRNVIAAARRGARALGVEYNPDMVELSRRLAQEAGVADKVSFVQGDMYEADISRATVMALFLLPSNLEKLKDKILALKPGTRVVLNTFTVPGWEADATERLEDGCENWCTALLHIIPAQVAGRWRLAAGELTLMQEFQMLSGTLSAGGAEMPIGDARLRGEEIAFTWSGDKYVGRVTGDRIAGTVTSADGGKRNWSATRVMP